jgi:hypothetical protein
MRRKYFLACEVRGHYVLEVVASSLDAAKRKAAVMLIPGMASPQEAPLWAGSVHHKIKRTTQPAASRAADRSRRKPLPRR